MKKKHKCRSFMLFGMVFWLLGISIIACSTATTTPPESTPPGKQIPSTEQPSPEPPPPEVKPGPNPPPPPEPQSSPKTYRKSLYKIEDVNKHFSALFLFNKDSNGTIHWARFSSTNTFPIVKMFKPASKGHNHGISVAVPGRCGNAGLIACLSTGRDAEAIKMGFKPLKVDYDAIRRELQVTLPFLQGFHINYILLQKAAGYGSDEVNERCVENLGDIKHSADFSFDEMFQEEDWSLIGIHCLSLKDVCFPTISLDYVWNEVETTD